MHLPRCYTEDQQNGRRSPQLGRQSSRRTAGPLEESAFPGPKAGWEAQETQPDLSLFHLKVRALASHLSIVIVLRDQLYSLFLLTV